MGCENKLLGNLMADTRLLAAMAGRHYMQYTERYILFGFLFLIPILHSGTCEELVNRLFSITIFSSLSIRKILSQSSRSKFHFAFGNRLSICDFRAFTCFLVITVVLKTKIIFAIMLPIIYRGYRCSF